MNLNALEYGLALKLQGFSKKYHLGLKVLNTPETLTGLIVLGDGTPDDWVIALISHHLNGSKTVGIIKPPGITGKSTFDLLHTLVVSNHELSNVVFFVDGEENGIKFICEALEDSLRKNHIDSQLSASQNEYKFRLYNCSISNRQFKLALIVNGIDKFPSETHKIEDHLLLTASEIKLINLPEKIDDPKQFWFACSSVAKENVFKELSTHKKYVELFFPQQLNGCNFLKS